MPAQDNRGPARPLPLDGVRVLDFSQVMMGPCCTQMLGDYGADVIKIERAEGGDLSRWSVGDDPDGGNNPVFASLNRNKRSVALNLKRAEDREIVLRLAETADVVVNNFRPGVMDRMGFGYEALRAVNPRIVYAVGTGYGLDGPNVHKGGQDVLAQAMSGVMHRRADPSLPLSVYPTALADYAAGMHLVQGILLALLQREKTGEGQQIAVSLFNSMLAMQMQEAAAWMMRGQDLNWAAMPLCGVFETTDGAIVMVGAFKKNPLAGYLPGARPLRTCPPTSDMPIWNGRSSTGRNCKRFSATASAATAPDTGWSGWARSTSCVRRSSRCRRRWTTRRPPATRWSSNLRRPPAGRSASSRRPSTCRRRRSGSATRRRSLANIRKR